MRPYVPGEFYNYHHHHHRGPRKFFWFILGGLITAGWMKAHQNGGFHCHSRVVKDEEERQKSWQWPSQHQWQYGQQPALPPPSAAPVQQQPVLATPAAPVVTQQAPAPAPASSATMALDIEKERQKVLEVKSKAADTMTDLSEATLDKILATVGSLKTKLAEHRAQQEEERRQHERELEELRNRRLV